MATPKKKPEDLLKAGRKSLYKEEYCVALINHMKQGGTTESFGIIPGVSIQTIYNWFDAHPEFLEAKKIGEPHLHQFFEHLGKGILTGQMKRIKSQKPAMGKNAAGDDIVLKDPTTGEIVYETEYEQVKGDSTMFVWLSKNQIGYKDKRDIQLTGKDGGPVKYANMTEEELVQEIKRLDDEAKKYVQ